jgi:hypothetical protein
MEIGGAEFFLPLPRYEEALGALEGRFAVVVVSSFRAGLLYIGSGALGIAGTSSGINFGRGAVVGTDGISRGPEGLLVV